MKKVFVISLLMFNISFGQPKTEKLVKSNFSKGLPNYIHFKFDKASFAEINHGKFFNGVFLICKDTTDFVDNLLLLYINPDKGFSIERVEFDSIYGNIYKSTIHLRTQSGDHLQPLYIYLTPPKFIRYNWGDSSGGTSLTPSIAKEYKLKVGMKLPDLKLETKNGIIHTNDFRGKIIFINWWATSCVPCRLEMPGLNKLFDKYNNKNVIFLSIVSDKENLDEFLSKNEFKFLHSYGDEDVQNILEGIYPRNIIVDKNGIIVYNKTGAKKDTYKVLDKILKNIFNE